MSSPLATAFVALGSNLHSQAGDPACTVQAAMLALASLGEVTAASSLYQTAPVGFQDQPAFINAVAAMRTRLAPHALLEKMLAIEKDFGRIREGAVHNGPRTLDLDLLLYDDLVLGSPTLTLPHPALAERRFVLAPLSEIAPGLMHPCLKLSMAALLTALAGEGEQAPQSVLRLAAFKPEGCSPANDFKDAS